MAPAVSSLSPRWGLPSLSEESVAAFHHLMVIFFVLSYLLKFSLVAAYDCCSVPFSCEPLGRAWVSLLCNDW